MTYSDIKAGDVLGVTGVGWLSDHIRSMTGGGPFSHVGLVVSNDRIIGPVVTEPLTRVRTHTLECAIEPVAAAWVIQMPLADDQRRMVCNAAMELSGETYNYGDILLQAMDSEFRTRWFTQHLMDTRFGPICSFLDASAFEYARMSLGVDSKSETPNDIYAFAVKYSLPMVKVK